MFNRKRSKPLPMTRETKRIPIDVISRRGKWEVHTASQVVEGLSKKDAVEIGRFLGRVLADAGAKAELTIRNRSGVITDKESYGSDPREIPG